MKIKYNINGNLKNETEQQQHCPSCKDGEVFTNEQIYRTDSMGDYSHEHICGTCSTKYKIPYIIPELGAESIKGIKLTPKDIDEFSMNENLVDNDNSIYFILKIGEEYKMEVQKMMHEVLGLREIYENTGECPEHKWITSQPFKTPEGVFTIENCAVCREAHLNYNGKKMTDTLSNLLNFLSAQGIAYTNNLKEGTKLFDTIIGNSVELDLNVLDTLPILEPIKDTLTFDFEEPKQIDDGSIKFDF